MLSTFFPKYVFFSFSSKIFLTEKLNPSFSFSSSFKISNLVFNEWILFNILFFSFSFSSSSVFSFENLELSFSFSSIFLRVSLFSLTKIFLLSSISKAILSFSFIYPLFISSYVRIFSLSLVYLSSSSDISLSFSKISSSFSVIFSSNSLSKLTKFWFLFL